MSRPWHYSIFNKRSEHFYPFKSTDQVNNSSRCISHICQDGSASGNNLLDELKLASVVQASNDICRHLQILHGRNFNFMKSASYILNTIYLEVKLFIGLTLCRSHSKSLRLLLSLPFCDCGTKETPVQITNKLHHRKGVVRFLFTR